MRNPNRIKELKDQRLKLCKDFNRYLDAYVTSRDSEGLSICMALLNSFDRSILRDNNLSHDEKYEILNTHEGNNGSDEKVDGV